jgi:hypothetical protein
MDVVAIYQLHGSTEELAHSLANALGITAYEARSRVSIPGGGPAVVASFAATEQAGECMKRLNAAGFKTIMIEPAQMETDADRLLIRQIHFCAHSLQFVTHDGQQLELPYHEINLLLRGAGIVSQIEVEKSTQKKFAPGRALVSGGLVMRKKVTTVTTNTKDERQPFCHLYATGQPPIVLRQADMDYSGLGENLQISRDANFNWICTELRRRCSAARWDERLQTRPGLAQVLGSTFDPERYLDLAISLIAQAADQK